MDIISIIVPVYNVKDYLQRCVDSLLAQTYTNIEIILVDDGSTDGSGKLCDDLAEREARVKVLHKENGGTASSRNAGFKIASGEYISHVDSDDWVSPEFIEKLHNLAVENDCEISECSYVKTDRQDETINNSNESLTIVDTETALKHNLQGTMFGDVVCCKLYKRSCLTSEFPEGTHHEDVFWVYQALSGSKKLVHTSDILYYYYQRTDSKMNLKYSLKRLDAVDAMQQRAAFVSEKYPRLGELAQGRFVEACMYNSQLIANACLDKEKKHRKDLREKAFSIGEEWKKGTVFSNKRKMWMKLYLTAPFLTCKIRNLLRIGL